jgi:hypothetical protein
MTETNMPLIELLQKRDEGDFLRAVTEAARPRDRHHELGDVCRAPLRQGLQVRPFRLNGGGVLPIAPRHQHIDEAPVVLDAGGVTAAAQDQCLIEGFLEVPVLEFNRPVLVGLTAVVAAGVRAVVADDCVVAFGDVLALIGGQVAESGREAVGPVVLRRAAQRPQGLLQVLGQRREAFPTKNHTHMFQAAVYHD